MLEPWNLAEDIKYAEMALSKYVYRQFHFHDFVGIIY